MSPKYITDKTCSYVREFKFVPESMQQIKKLQKKYGLCSLINNIEVEINGKREIGVMFNDNIYLNDNYYLFENVIVILRVNCDKVAYNKDDFGKWFCDEHIFDTN